ncbi:N-acetylmuramic acid 6-phosphate etherase [Ornithinibacillus bavariensis]|uniref:N-acetylmuramic acid 6-phosphate etherase n=1 Tax=Ornithinibacillus bavariensis TaxID=545502 RepID=A0A919X9A6_9BACI|nr:N-acetylmuramic acid 6-phosphate etherase [Ornithinibacillus bavariensis]
MAGKLDTMTVEELLAEMNATDQTVPSVVEKAIPQIKPVIESCIRAIQNGGKIIYMGAGTSGRLGVLDASECPPTFGVSPDLFTALIAGGERAIRQAVENAEDDEEQGAKELAEIATSNDVLIGIAASGRTPYVIGGINKAKELGIPTAGIVCRDSSPIAAIVDNPIELIVGEEFILGSTRLKSGTAQKLVLNMISSITMIKLGKVYDNYMVDVQASNIKLRERTIQIICDIAKVDEESAKNSLLACNYRLKAAVLVSKFHVSAMEAFEILKDYDDNLRESIEYLETKDAV